MPELCSGMERVDHLDMRDFVCGLIALRSSKHLQWWALDNTMIIERTETNSQKKDTKGTLPCCICERHLRMEPKP